jgi:hypothetical protein
MLEPLRLTARPQDTPAGDERPALAAVAEDAVAFEHLDRELGDLVVGVLRELDADPGFTERTDAFERQLVADRRLTPAPPRTSARGHRPSS